MYKTINKSTPNYLHNRFEYVKDKHQINTVSAASGNLFIPKLSSKTGQRSFLYRGVTAWNGLSVGARDYSLEEFKNMWPESFVINIFVIYIFCKYYILVYIFILLFFIFVIFLSYALVLIPHSKL